MIAPNITKPTRNPTEFDTENTEIRNSPRGMTGSAARSSAQMKRATSTTAATASEMIGAEPQA
jgi:hypothetical protein